MTDYGRGPGSEPWHPEDPLFGDQWGDNQPQYQGQQQHQHQPQQQDDWDPYATGRQPRYEQPQYEQPQYEQQQAYQQPQQQYGNWGAAPAGYGAAPGDPYGGQYGGHNGGHNGQGQPTDDHYGQSGYPPPQRPPYQGPPPQRQPQQQPLRTSPEPPSDWDPDPQPAADDHAFFSGAGDEGDEDGDDPREGRRARGGKGKKKGGKKRRSGCACLVVLLVLGGGLGGVSWYGYQYYQDKFGPAPDFSGSGKGEVQVEIPEGAFGNKIGTILKQAGVVKSVDAFAEAAAKNSKSTSIQAGIYVLRKEMSAESAITMMLDPASQNVLIVPEGLRATKIYALIDAKLGEAEGTTEKAAEDNVDSLGLPAYAGDNPEGFLYPARYSVGSKSTPVALLQQMVKNAKAEYTKLDLDTAGKKVNLDTAYDVIIEASILQAEVDQKADMGKAARALYNRLNTDATWGRLELDSTLQYHLGRTKLTGAELASKGDGFNTYTNKGLPPAPIANPGADAIEAVLNPSEGDWVYWVTVKAGDTRFAATWDDHLKNVKAYCEYHGQTVNRTSGSCQ